MQKPEQYPVSILTALPVPDKDRAKECLQKAMEGFDCKIVVLDDDPTGVQTVHDISVYTDWEENSVREGFQEESSMFFILTNSRSFSEEKTAAVHRQIAERVKKISRETGKDYFLISRGDSTLRGHYPLELDALAEGFRHTGAVSETPEDPGRSAGDTEEGIDGEILCPFFPEGGRVTFGNIHYVKEGDLLTPAGMTEFARDKTFGYSASDLKEYVEEKTRGRKRAEDCICISLEELAALDTAGIEKKLLLAENRAVVIVNAVTYEDLEVFCAALVNAMKKGKHFLARTAAAFTRVMGRVTERPLLTREEIRGEETRTGGLVIVGSHVEKTTRQLSCLKEADLPAVFLEFDVNAIFRENGLAAERDKAAALAEKAMKEGKTAVVYTSRQLLAPENLSREELLSISVKISDALTGIVAGIGVRPGFLVAKGGITSSDVGTRGLKVRKALVMGQIRKGIPVWRTGPESRFPGLAYIIFPGNVGEEETLREIAEELA